MKNRPELTFLQYENTSDAELWRPSYMDKSWQDKATAAYSAIH